MKLRDLEDKGDFSRDKNDLLVAGEFEETESRLELEVMLLATRTCCGWPRWMWDAARRTQPYGRKGTDAQEMRSDCAQQGARAKVGFVQARWCR